MYLKIGIVFFFTIPVFSTEYAKYQFELSEEKLQKLKHLYFLLDKEIYFHHPKWLKLIHYKKTFMGWESQIDSPDFFLAKLDPDKNVSLGKKNPRIEWLATIESFFLDQTFFNNIEIHPLCAFPARKKFLDNIIKDLKIENEIQFPKVDCKIYKLFDNEFKTKSLSLVFASYYLGAPASIFGHTFIKMNSYERDEILDYTINYAANPEDVDLFRYVLYGLFGGYFGYYSVMPYHIKIKEYNDIESRDLWEYELHFTEDQIDWILKHNWELSNFSYSYYYFATENCSYKILTLINIGLDDIDYLNEFSGFVIPSETIKKVNQQSLIKKRAYRPSIKSQILQRYELMNKSEKQYFDLILKKQLLPMEIQKENFNFLFVYDTLLLYYKFKKIQSKLDSETEDFYRKLLIERTQYPIDKNQYRFKETSTPPEESHMPSLVQIGYGRISDGISSIPIIDFSWRYLYHDFFNREWGLPKNSELENFSFTFHYELKNQKFYVTQFTLMNLYSLNPFNQLFFIPSYHVEIGYKNFYKEKTAFNVKNFFIYQNLFSEEQNQFIFYYNNQLYFTKSLALFEKSYLLTSFGSSLSFTKIVISLLGGFEINQKSFSPILENVFFYKLKGIHFLAKVYYYIKKEQFINDIGVSYNEFKNFEIRLLYNYQNYISTYKLGFSYLF